MFFDVEKMKRQAAIQFAEMQLRRIKLALEARLALRTNKVGSYGDDLSIDCRINSVSIHHLEIDIKILEAEIEMLRDG